MKVSCKKKVSNSVKNMVSKVVLFFLYKGFKVTYKHDDNVKKEINSWENGFSAIIDTGINNTKLVIKKENSKLLRLKEIENPDIEIKFKSPEVAFLMFTGRLGVSRAYAEHRFTLKGEIGKAMSLVRCIDIVEAYLFPSIITKNILKYKPQKSMGIIRTYVFALLNI